MSLLTKIINQISFEDFSIPILQKETDYFPDFLKSKLCEFTELYEKKLLPHVDEGLIFSSGDKDVIISKIRSLSFSITKAIDYFYTGDILKATTTFNQGLNDVFFKDLAKLNLITEIAEHTKFFRSRVGENKRFDRSDLFHINFKQRHIVSTNRYSIPGFPALYFGDNTYICWEEFGQPDLKNLHFSLFKNMRTLKVIQLLKIEDLLKEFTENKSENIPFLLAYFTFFPLTIACSIKVKNNTGNFKPEYIIPQLLLQFVSEDNEIDGIKFPSTKIDYSKLHNFSPYNYVFPVKNVKPEGYCDTLKNTFHCTQPTSLNLEEIRYNPFGTVHLLPPTSNDQKIELVEDLKSPYTKTSFGKIEYFLENREIKQI